MQLRFNSVLQLRKQARAHATAVVVGRVVAAGVRGSAYKAAVHAVFSALNKKLGNKLVFAPDSGSKAKKAPKKPPLPFVIARAEVGSDDSDDDVFRWTPVASARAQAAVLAATVQRHTLRCR
jgi:hypothetical protein